MQTIKPGYKTTELLLAVLTSVGALASALAGVLPPKWAAVVAAVASLAYSLSRGLAKLTVPSGNGTAAPPRRRSGGAS